MRDLHTALPFLLTLAGNVAGHPTRRTDTCDANTNSNYQENAGVLQYVNPLIGTNGPSPNSNGGMIPSVAPPFAMTRWTPQTRENFISQCPYSEGDALIHGFQATHQPAIWMGEAGQVVLTPGMGEVQPLFVNRGLAFRKKDEISTPYVYEVLLDATQLLDRDLNATAEYAHDGPDPGGAGAVPENVEEGANGRTRKRSETQIGIASGSAGHDDAYKKSIQVGLSAGAHAGHLRFDYRDCSDSAMDEKAEPWVFIEVSRQNWTGEANIDTEAREVYGYNTERQDYLLGPDHADSFKGYFVSRFSEPFASAGVTNGNTTIGNSHSRTGKYTGAFVKFHTNVTTVEVRTGVSYVSVEQARRNLDIETPDGSSIESTVKNVKTAWLEKLDRVTIEGANKTDSDHDPRTIFYTSLYHALQYPSDFSEPVSADGKKRTFYSGYTDSVHTAEDSYYQSWSIWDTYRAESSLLTLFAPERVNSMMRSLLRIFDWSGWLPMWANMIETNIMISTNADAVLANALTRGFRGFDIAKAWTAVKKDAYTAPERDLETLYYDREANTSYEVRAGLTAYMKQGWVSNDGWSEAGSRTLDYAFDDYACSIVGAHAGADNASIEALRSRSGNYAKIWNNETQFMQARNGNGSWANNTWGWTEGDDWVYTFDVLHDVKGLADLFGSREAMRDKLDVYFQGGHNDQTNEPSHHVPYLYSVLGYPDRAAETIPGIAWSNYNATSSGLSGNDDLGQTSAWYIFSALGFYPVNPASDQYIVGTPFFEKITIRFSSEAAPGGRVKDLVISAPGAPNKPYIKSLKIGGKKADFPVLTHSDIVSAGSIEFEMSDSPTVWGRVPTWEV